MTRFLACWTTVAKALFTQALAGEPTLCDSRNQEHKGETFGICVTLSGEEEGNFTVVLDSEILRTPLLGEGNDQKAGWKELLREVAESAVGELLASAGRIARIDQYNEVHDVVLVSQAYELKSSSGTWNILIRDETQVRETQDASNKTPVPPPAVAGECIPRINPSIELLQDVELEATLRFGCREIPLCELLDLGPGDVVELDRHVNDPVDLIVGDRIVASGNVVILNGNFALTVTAVAAPRKRLESIRCLF